MATATVSARADGIHNHAVGSFTGDGALTRINVGFNPIHFIIINITDVVRFEKLGGQPAADTLKTISAGTMTEDTTSAVLFNGDGSVTISAATGITAKVFAWAARR